MNVGIIGGGLTGLALAERLSRRGHRITVLERDHQLGGLATWHDFGSFVWDRFYHVILPSDRHLLGFLEDIGLEHDVRWRRTLTGYYQDRTFYSISSNWEFLRFPPLNLLQKARLAATILYCSQLDDWRRLEGVTVEEWLVRMGGRGAFDRFWKPLLLAKMGESYRRVSAVFIWAYIKRLFSARDASASSNEQLGHVTGGYRTVFDRLRDRIDGAGGLLLTGVTARAVAADPGGGLRVELDGEWRRFDKVVCTLPVGLLRRLAKDELLRLSASGDDIEYLGVVCAAVLSRRPLTPFYVVNIADRRVPFTGVIGMSNLVAPQETAGLHLTYLPKYVLADDPLLRASDDQVRELFLAGLDRMFPDLAEAGIESVHVNRAPRVQALQVLGYSRLVPEVETRHPDFFVLNTSQFVSGTLNNNSVIGAVDDFIERYGHQLETRLDAATGPASRPPAHLVSGRP